MPKLMIHEAEVSAMFALDQQYDELQKAVNETVGWASHDTALDAFDAWFDVNSETLSRLSDSICKFQLTDNEVKK